MKTFLIIFLSLFITNNIFSQYQKTAVIDVPELNSEQIYKLTKEWFFNSFKSAKSVIDVDISGQKIMGKGLHNFNIPQTSLGISTSLQQTMDIIITIDIKDQKYRYKIESSLYFMESPSIEKIQKTMDSTWSTIEGSWMVSKKQKEKLVMETKANQDVLVQITNKEIKQTIDNLEVSLKNTISLKKDSW